MRSAASRTAGLNYATGKVTVLPFVTFCRELGMP